MAGNKKPRKRKPGTGHKVHERNRKINDFNAQQHALSLANQTPLDTKIVMAEPWEEYENLTRRVMKDQGYMTLCQFCTLLAVLARLLKNRGKGDAGLFAWSMDDQSERAAECLKMMAERRQLSGHYIATDKELGIVFQMLMAIERIGGALTTGEFYSALHVAANAIDQAFPEAADASHGA